jgi:outer membrane protein OmpA-like peptidoglycan-associated protein
MTFVAIENHSVSIKLKTFVLFFFSSLQLCFGFASDSLHSNCTNAQKVILSKPLLDIKAMAPQGFGSLQEIKANKTNCFVFEQEHHTAWYQISMVQDGEFALKISPNDTLKADYDFVVYQYTDSSFCSSLSENKTLPLRSNLSRNRAIYKGKTGLQLQAKSDFIKEGIGEAYSKSISAKKGDQYMLVIDNVYGDEKGYLLTLTCKQEKQLRFKGIVLGEDSLPATAKITLSDDAGKVVAEKQANDFGKYDFAAIIDKSKNYTLAIEKENAFPVVEQVSTAIIKDTSKVCPPLKTILPKLKKGNRYKLGVIQFFPGSSQLLPISNSPIFALYKLMKANPRMVIEIEGHVNGDTFNPTSALYMNLSKARAQTVYDYLIDKGIEKERCSTIGLGSTKMLYSHSNRTWGQMQANMRVEIKIISVNGK